MNLGGTVATIGFPDPAMRDRGSRPRCWRTATTGEIAIGKSNFDRRMTRAIFKSAWSLQTATMQPGKWQDEHRPLAASGVPQSGMNYAVKSREGRHVAVPNFRDADTASLPILESVPAVSAKLKSPNSKDEKFEDVVKSAQQAAVLVLVY